MDTDNSGVSQAVAMTIGDVGLLHIRSHPETEFNIEEAKEALKWASQASGDHRKPYLLNLSGSSKVSPKVFFHFANNVAPNEAVALAVVVDSPLMASIGRVVWGLNQPKIPMRIYNTTSEAMDWLTGNRERV
jgi:hypothetical protein